MKVKKILSAFIAAAMVLSTMSFTAFADGETPAAPAEITPDYEWYTAADAEATEYEIDTVADLAGLAKITQNYVLANDENDETVPADDIPQDNFAGKTVVLAQDITFADNEYLISDVGNYQIKNFAGTFDGNEKTITGLKLNGSGNYICLFNSITTGGAVTDLTLDNVIVDGSVNWSGGITGLVNDGASVTDCTVKNITVTGDSVKNFGGIAAYVYGGGCITGCNVDNVVVKSKGAIKNSGGLLGRFLANSTVSDNIADNITLESDEETSKYVGGFAGLAYGDVTNCSANNVTITIYGSSYIGGFLGATFATNGVELVTVENCHATNVNIFGLTEDIGYHQNYKGDFQQSGGFVGMLSANNNLIKDCTLTDAKIGCNGTLNGVGGFLGHLQKQGEWSLVMENCAATNVELKGATLVHTGGMIGLNNGNTMTVKNATLTNVTLTTNSDNNDEAAIETTNKVGGFIGYNAGSLTLEGCNANVVKMKLGSNPNDNIKATGGFIGQMYGGTATVKDCNLYDLDATITGAYESSFAGFVGTQNGNTAFENCSVSGKIDATNVKDDASTGGFLGDLGYAGKSTTTIDGCSADVDIVANGAAGGFIASSWGYKEGTVKGEITVSNSVATGDVKSLTDTAGGFVGVGDRGTYENCSASGNVTSEGTTSAAGGFWGVISENKTDMEDKLVLNGCEAHGTVTGSEAGGLVGTITVTPDDFAVESDTGYIKIENCNDRNTVVNATTEKHYFANLLGNPTVGYLSLETAIADAGVNGGTITVDDEQAAIVVEKNATEVTQGEGVTVGANAANTVINDKNNVIAAAAEAKIIKLMTDAPGSTTITVARKDIVKYEKHATDNNKIVVDIEPTLTIDGTDVPLTFDGTDVDVTVKVDSALNGAKLKVYHEDDETTPVNGDEGTEVVDGQLTFTTNKGFSKYIIDGVSVVVDDETKISDGIKVVLEKTDSENKYLLKLVASEDGKSIYRFATAEMKFNFETADNLTYTVTPAAGISQSVKADETGNKNNDLYLFNADSTNIDENGEATITKGEIVLATVEFNTYGTFTFNVQADAKVQGARELEHSNKKDYTVATNNLEVKIDKTGTELEGDAIIDNVTLAEKKELMTIELICDNYVENNTAGKDYQDMTITIERVGNTAAKKVIGLYYGQDEQKTTDTDIKSITYISSTDVASKYVVAVELPVNADYTITLSGAGYRTFTYTKDNFTAPTTLRFWNDEEHKLPEEIEIGSGKKFETTFLAGDIIEDTKIDIYDLNAVVSYWGTDELVTKYPDYNKYDLNRDGKVDQTDVTYVLLSWGY